MQKQENYVQKMKFRGTHGSFISEGFIETKNHA